MAKSRYSDTPIIDQKYYRNFILPKISGGLKRIDFLEGVRVVEHVYSRGDRLDHLAAKYLGDGRYWWVIALVNDIDYPFASGGLTYGRKLLIPSSVQDVLTKLLG